MHDFIIECLYCGIRYEKQFYSKSQIESETCMSCKDSNLKATPRDEAYIDTYKGSPPFPKKTEWTF